MQKERKTNQRYITNQPKENMNGPLKELSTRILLETMSPRLSTLGKVCLTPSVGTTLVKHSSKMVMVKT